jgi:hypothetical protein
MQSSLHSCPSDLPVCRDPFSLSTFRSPNSRFFSGSKSSGVCISQRPASKQCEPCKTNQKPTTISAVSQWQMRVEIMLLLWNSGRWIERSKDGGISCDESCEIAAKKTEQDRVGSKLYIMEIMFSPSCHPLEEGLVHILQPSNWMCTPASPKDIVSVHQKL